MLTIALVVMVIFLFLRSLSATVIPGHCRPAVSDRHFRRDVHAGLQPRQPLAHGADHLDRLRRRRRHRDDREHLALSGDGRQPMEAALKGSGEIGFTIVSLTVSLIAVLIPLLFMADIVGRLFREFAVTLAVTIILSAFVSLTLTPMMAARILKHHPESEQGRFYRWSEWCFVKTIEQYGKMVRVVLRHQPADAAGRGGHSGAHRLSLHHRSQRLLPGAGYRRDPRDFGGPRNRFVSVHGRRASSSLRRDPAGSGGREPYFVYRRGRHQYHAQRGPHSDHPEASRGTRRRLGPRSHPPPAAEG